MCMSICDICTLFLLKKELHGAAGAVEVEVVVTAEQLLLVRWCHILQTDRPWATMATGMRMKNW
jgi:hypothetical protein